MHITLNQHFTLSTEYIGEEQTPVVIIDDLLAEPYCLIREANTDTEYTFRCQESDYYPGVRKPAPLGYQTMLKEALWPKVNQHLGSNTRQCRVTLSAYSIATTQPKELRPIQMLPHFDTTNEHQFAVVHYLCDKRHGGTAFYRHKNTRYERIIQSRLKNYSGQLKQQAMSANLHENPAYIDGDTPLFEQIYTVEAQLNRAIIYPSNMLHSGNIRPQMGLSDSPLSGRLTISSFLCG